MYLVMYFFHSDQIVVISIIFVHLKYLVDVSFGIAGVLRIRHDLSLKGIEQNLV